jgi:uncharacterized protein (DUF2141 family)
MNHRIAILTLTLICYSTVYSAAQHTLEIVVKNIKETTGTIRVGLFTNEHDFLKKAEVGQITKVSAHELTVHFTNLTPGAYALSVIHDKNENGELDTNLIGIPNEPFGFSNNVMGSFGPPSFEKAKITIKDDVTSVITLR